MEEYERDLRIPLECYTDIINGGEVTEDKLYILASSAKYSYLYSLYTGKRFPRGESMVATVHGYSFLYARNVIKGLFPEGEKVILTSPMSSSNYAYNIIQGPWIEAEDIISTSAAASFKYAKNILRGRFLKGENAIATNSMYSVYYAKYVIKGRFPEGEVSILGSVLSESYSKFILNGK